MARTGTLLLLLLLVAVLATAEKPKGYTTKYDDVDVERILSNGRILTNYIKCLMDEGPCTPEGRELKSKLAAVHVQDCGRAGQVLQAFFMNQKC